MAEEKKQSNNKLLIVIIILLLVVIIAGGIIAFLLISKDGNDNSSSELIKVNDDATVEILGNDSFLILNEEDVPDKDEMQKKVDAGMMNLNFSNEIVIENGKDGTCNISNSNANSRDMYVSIWLSETEEEIYRSGLIPVGTKIKQLELNHKLEPGKYTGIMVYNQLEDDKIVAQVNVEVTLNVKS